MIAGPLNLLEGFFDSLRGLLWKEARFLCEGA